MTPAYLTRLLAAFQAGAVRPGGVRVATVKHDDWCALLKGTGLCDCEPDVTLGPELPRGDS